MSLTFNLILLSLLFAHGISLDCEVRRDRVLYEDQSHSIAYRCVPQDAPDEVYDIPFQIVQQLQRHFEKSNEPTGTYVSIPGARVPIVPKTITSKSRLYDGSLNTVPTDTLSHELIVPENVQIVISNQRQHRQLAPKKQGELSILVVRAIASDAQTTLSEEILFERIFSDTSRSLSSVYNDCSFGKLKFIPATGASIVKGIVTVNISATSAVSQSALTVASDIEAATIKTVGVLSQWDYVMYCLPPGTSLNRSWLAFGDMSSSSIVLNDKCGAVSVVVQELGYKMGLGYSDENNKSYDDQSSIMGLSYNETGGPAM